MSPNEEQLRRALRSGEGEPLDAAAMITHARTVRHTRRVRLTSVAATVFAVAAVGIGSAVAFGTHHASTPAADPGSSTHPTDGSTLRVTATAANPSPTAQVNCPVTVPHLMLPGGGGSGQFGANGPLFDGPVASARICGFTVPDATGTAHPSGAFTVVGAQAAELAASLEAATTILPCPSSQMDPHQTLVVIGVGADGTVMKPVVVALACDGPITNGTAVRHHWIIPADLSIQIQRLAASPIQTSTLPPHRAVGSPVH